MSDDPPATPGADRAGGTDLEARLDAVVLRAGFAATIYQARQAVSHGHVTVSSTPAEQLWAGQACRRFPCG